MRNFLESGFFKGLFGGRPRRAAALVGFAYGQANLPDNEAAGHDKASRQIRGAARFWTLLAGL